MDERRARLVDPDTADPSWFPRVLRTLARDFPEVAEQVWTTAVTENAHERIAAAGFGPLYWGSHTHPYEPALGGACLQCGHDESERLSCPHEWRPDCTECPPLHVPAEQAPVAEPTPCGSAADPGYPLSALCERPRGHAGLHRARTEWSHA